MTSNALGNVSQIALETTVLQKSSTSIITQLSQDSCWLQENLSLFRYWLAVVVEALPELPLN